LPQELGYFWQQKRLFEVGLGSFAIASFAIKVFSLWLLGWRAIQRAGVAVYPTTAETQELDDHMIGFPMHRVSLPTDALTPVRWQVGD